jgi:hypothetical protein
LPAFFLNFKLIFYRCGELTRACAAFSVLNAETFFEPKLSSFRLSTKHWGVRRAGQLKIENFNDASRRVKKVDSLFTYQQ